jgi:peptidyl-prolyl cis-trans isomerase B (cyclophilin B)
MGEKTMNKNIKVLMLVLIASLVFFMVGCVEKVVEKEEVEDPQQTEGGNEMNLEQLNAPQAGEEIAVITTNHGEIKLRLFPEVAPKAVENFKTHAKDGYYNGVSFHRVMNDFMIQGGDPEGTGRGGESIWGAPFEDEFSSDYRNVRGALSMANAGPGTNGSQFFIVQTTETPWLDGRHTVFGQVFEGMDVVDKIASVDVDGNDKPKEPVLMEKVEIIEFK